MTQTFGNFAQTTLSGTITSGATSLGVASMTTFKDENGVAMAAPFTIQIDNELLLVTAIAGTTLSVTRGSEGTAAASHTSGTVVKPAVSAASLQNLARLAHVGTAVPTGGTSGDMRVGTGKLWANDAGTWKSAPLVASGSTINSVTVSSIAALKTELANNARDEIIVANGTYAVAPASGQAATSLWIGAAFTGRTRPVSVLAQTSGGVTFDGGGNQTWGGISFQDGAHDQTWDGFKFANGRPFETGVIMFGGYGLAGAHHITLRNITIMPSITGPTATNKDHCMYFSQDAAHDILIEDYTATPGPNIQSALQFTHDPNVYNLTVRRMHVTGTQSTILFYTPTVHDVLIEDSDITNARDAALNANETGANVVLRNVTSVNSGGAYYPSGQPAGLTLINCSLA